MNQCSSFLEENKLYELQEKVSFFFTSRTTELKSLLQKIQQLEGDKLDTNEKYQAIILGLEKKIAELSEINSQYLLQLDEKESTINKSAAMNSFSEELLKTFEENLQSVQQQINTFAQQLDKNSNYGKRAFLFFSPGLNPKIINTPNKS